MTLVRVSTLAGYVRGHLARSGAFEGRPALAMSIHRHPFCHICLLYKVELWRKLNYFALIGLAQKHCSTGTNLRQLEDNEFDFEASLNARWSKKVGNRYFDHF